ncbi:MAG: 30S ribosomal protein S6 [Candidatus Omnitrophota bacterium]
MKEYQALFIIDAAKANDLKEVSDAIKNSITKASGEIKKEENWGKQKLTYPVKKNAEGVYYKLNFSLAPSGMKELNAAYKLNQDILRVMITAD